MNETTTPRPSGWGDRDFKAELIQELRRIRDEKATETQ